MSKKAITIVGVVVVIIVIVIGIGISIAKADVTEGSAVEVSGNAVQVLTGNVYEVVPAQVAYELVVCPVKNAVRVVDVSTRLVTATRVVGEPAHV